MLLHIYINTTFFRIVSVTTTLLAALAARLFGNTIITLVMVIMNVVHFLVAGLEYNLWDKNH